MLTPSILEAALAGLEAQRERITTQIAEIRSRLGIRGPGRPKSAASAAAAGAGARPRRQMSAAARKAIATAQKKRWAAYHAAKNKG